MAGLRLKFGAVSDVPATALKVPDESVGLCRVRPARLAPLLNVCVVYPTGAVVTVVCAWLAPVRARARRVVAMLDFMIFGESVDWLVSLSVFSKADRWSHGSYVV